MTKTLVKIAFIGAGSIGFGQKVLTDLLTFPSLREDLTICLEDVDAHRLALTFQLVEKLKGDNPGELAGVTFEKTTNQREAIAGAKYVISAAQVGGLEAMKLDLEIPEKYGVRQVVGDSLGSGGVFRFLRTAPVFRSIVEQMREVGYNAGARGGGRPLFLNYTNPMAMNTWYCNSVWPGSTVGLCHGVQGTAAQLRAWVGATPEEFSYLCAGINHMAWFLEVRYRDYTKGRAAPWEDAYPVIWRHVEEEGPDLLMGDLLRYDVMKATGYYMTESSGHLAEYLPYYLKRDDLIREFASPGITGFSTLEQAYYYKSCLEAASKMDRNFERKLRAKTSRLKKRPSEEYVSNIINAIETGVPFRFNGNVMNRGQGLITNLPRDCCVEVPVFADAHGLHPQGGIELPTVCQALCTSNVMV
ncbi:MAG: family 4 glycosyl hydrolase, partial [Promethearchaeota archaeon]